MNRSLGGFCRPRRWCGGVPQGLILIRGSNAPDEEEEQYGEATEHGADDTVRFVDSYGTPWRQGRERGVSYDDLGCANDRARRGRVCLRVPHYHSWKRTTLAAATTLREGFRRVRRRPGTKAHRVRSEFGPAAYCTSTQSGRHKMSHQRVASVHPGRGLKSPSQISCWPACGIELAGDDRNEHDKCEQAEDFGGRNER